MPQKMHVATIGKPHGIKGAMSILSKTRPQEIIFSIPLELDSGAPFEVLSFEVHHTKVVCMSESVQDRNQSGSMRQTKLYCNQDEFFKSYPEQIFEDLCAGYQVTDINRQILGILEYVEFIRNIPFLILKDSNQIFHLPANIQDINHDKQALQLNYAPE